DAGRGPEAVQGRAVPQDHGHDRQVLRRSQDHQGRPAQAGLRPQGEGGRRQPALRPDLHREGDGEEVSRRRPARGPSPGRPGAARERAAMLRRPIDWRWHAGLGVLSFAVLLGLYTWAAWQMDADAKAEMVREAQEAGKATPERLAKIEAEGKPTILPTWK